MDKVVTEIVPCGEKNYVIINESPFPEDSGIDSAGIEVQCKGCGKTYYLFPKLESKSTNRES